MTEEFKQFIKDYHDNLNIHVENALDRMDGYINTEAVVIKDSTMFVHMILKEAKEEMSEWFCEYFEVQDNNV